MIRILGTILLAFLLASCSTARPDFDMQVVNTTYKELNQVEELKGDPIVIAVYDFIDLTGQKKPGGAFASMSTAVTQGSYQLLIKALQDAGDGKWFRVVERASLPSLLQERKLIRSTRQQVDGEGAESLPPLLFAGAYITGGIVGYDSDVKSGGVGARILGLQAHKQYRQDIVTIILRLVNVQTGEVVLSTTIEKTIFSTETGADIFKYLDTDTMLLEVEAGVARNEPVTFAVRKAIEKGVVEIISLGVEKKLWEFKELVVELGVDNKKKKTYEEFLKEKEKAKELKTKTDKALTKTRKLELANYNKENGTKFKTWSEYLGHLNKIKVAQELKLADEEKRRLEIKAKLKEDKIEEVIADEETNNDSGDTSSTND